MNDQVIVQLISDFRNEVCGRLDALEQKVNSHRCDSIIELKQELDGHMACDSKLKKMTTSVIFTVSGLVGSLLSYALFKLDAEVLSAVKALCIAIGKTM